MSKKKKTKPLGKNARNGPPRSASEVRIADHPRARRQIALAKSYASLAAFGLVAWATWRGGAPFYDVVSRALLWGVAAYLVVWALGVHVWRHVAVAEVRAAEKRWKERRAEEEEQIRKLTKVLEDNGMPTTGTGAMP